MTGTCYLNLKKNQFLKLGTWIVNDPDYILTNENGEDVFTAKLIKIKNIQERLNEDFNLETLSHFNEDLNDDFIVNYLNINLTKKTFNDAEIKTTFKDYNNTRIVHDYTIPEEADCVCVDFKNLNTIQRLKVFDEIRDKKNMKWVLVHAPSDFKDYFTYFNINTSIMIKNHIVFLNFV